MVLDVGHMCDGVHKTHCPIEVLEGELTADRPGIRHQLPAILELCQQLPGSVACQRCDATLTRLALLLRKLSHASTARSVSVTSSTLLRVKLRATYFSTRF